MKKGTEFLSSFLAIHIVDDVKDTIKGEGRI